MNWLARLFPRHKSTRALTPAKSTTELKFMAYYGHGQVARMPINFNAFSEEGYSRCVVAYACINLLAEAIGGLKWLVYRREGKRRVEVENHPVLDLLAKPSPFTDQKSFIESLVAFRLISGNSFVRLNNAGGRGKNELQLLPPNAMGVRVGRFGGPEAYVCNPHSGGEISYPVDPVTGLSEVMNWHTFNPLNPWIGLSPIQSMALQIDTLNYSDRWNLGLIQNGARPTGAVVMKSDEWNQGQLTDAQKTQLQKDLDERFTAGGMGTGRPFILYGGLDWKQFGLSPVDMDFLNSKKVSKIDVATAYRVPPQMIGVEDSQTYANMEQARLLMYEDTVIPLGQSLASALNRWLMPQLKVEGELSFDLDEITALAPRRKEVFEQLKGSDWLTPNEKRERHGYSPYTKKDSSGPADKLYISAGLIPIDSAGESFEIDPVEDTGDIAPSKPTTEDPPEPELEEDEPEQDDPKAMLSPEQKASARRIAQWRKQEALRLTFERRLSKTVSGLFIAEAKAMSASLSGVVRLDIAEIVLTDVLGRSEDRWVGSLGKQLTRTIEAFDGLVQEQVKSSAPHLTIEKKDAPLRNFIAAYLGTLKGKVRKITANTKSKVMDALRDDIREAQASGVEVDLGRAAARAYAGFTVGRTKSISRTETHEAAQESSRNAARNLSLPGLSKEWAAASDERTRESHAQMDGTKIPMDDKFSVPSNSGTDEMDGPGDPKASAENKINCRCATIYSVES